MAQTVEEPKSMPRLKFQWPPSASALGREFLVWIRKPTKSTNSPNQQTSAFLNLPTELLLEIASFLPTLGDLNSLIRTHSRFVAAISPVLYRKALIPEPEGIGAPFLLRSFVFSDNYNALNTLLNVYNVNPNEPLTTKLDWWSGPQPREQSLLHLTVSNANIGIARLLLEAGMQIDVTDSTGTTPLHLASQIGNLEMMKLLLSYGANLEAVDNHRQTPFFRAAGCNKAHVREQAVQILLTAGANPNALVYTFQNGVPPRIRGPALEWSALHALAVKSSGCSDDEMITFLVKHGADVELPLPGRHPPCTPLALLTELLVWYKLELKRDIPAPIRMQLVEHYHRRLKTVKVFLEAGADIKPALLALQPRETPFCHDIGDLSDRYPIFKHYPLFPVNHILKPIFNSEFGLVHELTVGELDNIWGKAGQLVKIDLERVRQQDTGDTEEYNKRQTGEAFLRDSRIWQRFSKPSRL